MAGKITWAIEFIGLDTALLKLKAIDRTLQSISRHQGTSILGNQGGIGGNRNVVVPAGRGGGVGAAAATGAAVGAATGISKEALSVLYGIGAISPTGKSYKHMYNVSQMPPPVIPPTPPRDIGRPLPPPKGFLDLRPLAEKWSEASKPKGKKIDWFEGIQAHLKKFGHALSATGTPGVTNLGGMLTKLGGVASKLGVIGLVVTAVLVALAVALKFLLKGVEEGSRIYQEAAAAGVGIKQTSQLEQALKSIGINEKPTYMMQSAASSGGTGMVGAARASGFGGAQQLQNMAKEFATAMIDAKNSAQQMALAGKANQIMSMDLVAIQREWKTLLAQSAAAMYPLLHGMFEIIKNWMKLLNLYIEFWNWIKSKIPGLLPTGDPGKARWAQQGGGGGMPNVTSWEKIGFTFGRGGPTEVLNDIKKNTSMTNTVLEKIYEAFKLLGKAGGLGAAGVAAGYLP